MTKIIIFLFLLSTFVGAKALNFIHYDPFKKAKVLLKTKSTKMKVVPHTPKSLTIDAILNKRVYIDGRFYVAGKVVHGYKIIHIADRYIKVKKRNKIIIIPLIKSNYFKNIKIEG